MIIKIDFNNEETLKQLDRKINFYDAGNHYPPKLYCSQSTMLMLGKYKDRFPKIKDMKEYQGMMMYYICEIVIDNNYSFGEIEIR